MLLFYIRHGDPIYNPDSLTPLGKKQADAVAKRLALYGIDRVYASSSNRAIQTAQPACDLLKKEPIILDFANESYGWEDLTIERNGRRKWLFHDEEAKIKLCDEDVAALGHKWYNHEYFSPYKKGIERVEKEAFEFLKQLGYEKISSNGKYKVLNSNNERVAFFAHQGFGMSFLSQILGIPYPMFASRFNMSHTGVTVIEFKEEDGIAIPKVLTLSSDSHLYREGLTTKYNNELYF